MSRTADAHEYGIAPQAARESGEQSPVWKWRYILAGGAPPVAQSLTAGDGDILCTGHRDGRVRVWDATAEVQDVHCCCLADTDFWYPIHRLHTLECM